MATKRNNQKIATEFTRTREYIRRYVVLDDDELDVTTAWAMHTHLFSPACETPPTTPYLYITAAKGSGKTLLGQDVLGTIVRASMPTVGITGPGLIRLVGGSDSGGDDDENGSDLTVAASPTLSIDEVDALYSGAKDEVLRMMLNAGYRQGGVVPRVVGKSVVNYSAFCPKILMGIDNGHLPDTVTDRSIRIDLKMASPEDMQTVEPFYHFEVEDEAAELSHELAEWAKRNSVAIKSYRPEAIEGLKPRQWEIARTLVQVAHAIGNETRIREAVKNLLTKNPSKQDARVRMYESIQALFTEYATDRVTSNQILERLEHDGIAVPGGSGAGLAAALKHDGALPTAIRFPAEHPHIQRGGKNPARGYYRSSFDEVFSRMKLNTT